MATSRKILVPIGVLILFIGMSSGILLLRSEPQKKSPSVSAPLVRVQAVKLQKYTATINSFGVARARHSVAVASEVEGKVIAIHPDFIDGGYVKSEQMLLTVDPSKYTLAVARAAADLAKAEFEYLRTKTDKKSAFSEQKILRDLKKWNLNVSDDPSLRALSQYIPQIKLAKAELEFASEDLKEARKRLAKTKLVAPFDGYIEASQLSVGQIIKAHEIVGNLVAVSPLLVDAQVSLADAAWIPTGKQDVEISKMIDGQNHRWQGTLLHRMERLEEIGNLITFVIEVKKTISSLGLRMPRGLFVTVKIRGKAAENVTILPKSALRENNMLWVADADGTLAVQGIKVVHATNDIVVVRGVSQGINVIVSYLSRVASGMKVTVAPLQKES